MFITTRYSICSFKSQSYFPHNAHVRKLYCIALLHSLGWKFLKGWILITTKASWLQYWDLILSYNLCLVTQIHSFQHPLLVCSGCPSRSIVLYLGGAAGGGYAQVIPMEEVKHRHTHCSLAGIKKASKAPNMQRPIKTIFCSKVTDPLSQDTIFPQY